MNALRRERLKKAYQEKLDRLAVYQEREKTMLQGGVQSYGIGQRNLARYNTDLAVIVKTIKELEKEIEELEAQLCGESARRRVGMVFNDW